MWSFLDLLFPRNCVFCNRGGVNICDECISRKFIKAEKICHVCNKKILSQRFLVHTDCASYTKLDGVFSCFQYNKEAKEILHLIKYDGCHDIIHDVVRSMLERFSQLPVGFNFLVPVPIHKDRYIKRGFNQAELIAKYLTWNYKNILIRIKNTKPQFGLDKSERIGNVENAFELAGGAAVKDKNILLVDDVLTTGSTLENCAAVLKQHGANKVYGFTWAKD